LMTLGDPIIIQDAIFDSPIAVFSGIPPSQLRVNITAAKPPLPEYVLEAKRSIPRPEPNNQKVFLASWTPPILDRGSVLELTLGYTDFWTNLAVETCRGRLHQEMLRGNLSLFSFPRRLDTVIVVLTADGRVALAKRAGDSVVKYYPLTWEVSAGESMDASEDLGESGKVDPTFTVRRGLYEELGIPEPVAGEADIKFVALGTEWPLLFVNLVAVTRLTTCESGKLKEWWPGRPDREHTILDTIEFSLDSCLKIALRGRHEYASDPDSNAPLYPMARLALFCALCSQFGYANVISRL